MKRILFLFLLVGLATGASGQKSRVLAVFQMIDQAKYEEAKEDIELAVWNDKTSRWHRTYYAKGLLCQAAYENGYKDNDQEKMHLYPDQLYLAYDSYERALELDARGRLHTEISQRYYYLSNDFRKLGEEHFEKKEYQEAFRAFEHALLVNNSDLVSAKVDTGLIYNTAMAAFESKNWGKATGYLTGLHDAAYSPATSLLLHQANINFGDTVRAEEVLLEAVRLHEYDEQVIVYLINLYVNTDRLDLAISILDDAIEHRPEYYRLYWGKGLVYRRMDLFDEALENFKAALELAPDEPKIYYQIGVIYYNRGIGMREESLEIEDNKEYRELRKKAREQFIEAVSWLEKSYEMDPLDEKTISRLYQLYHQLQWREKEESMKLLIE